MVFLLFYLLFHYLLSAVTSLIRHRERLEYEGIEEGSVGSMDGEWDIKRVELCCIGINDAGGNRERIRELMVGHVPSYFYSLFSFSP